MIVRVRPFSRSTEADFPETESVPEELRQWWVTTRENLNRITDRISDIEGGETISPATSTLIQTSGSAAELFSEGSSAFSQAEEDFLRAFLEE